MKDKRLKLDLVGGSMECYLIQTRSTVTLLILSAHSPTLSLQIYIDIVWECKKELDLQ